MVPSTVMSKNWSDILRANGNKTELFALLSRVVVCLSVGEGNEFMQQMEIESSALLLSHVWPTLPNIHKKRPTINYFCMWQMLCKRGIGR